MKWLGIKLLQLTVALVYLWVTYASMLLCFGPGTDDAPRYVHWLAWLWLIIFGIGMISFFEKLLEPRT